MEIEIKNDNHDWHQFASGGAKVSLLDTSDHFSYEVCFNIDSLDMTTAKDSELSIDYMGGSIFMGFTAPADGFIRVPKPDNPNPPGYIVTHKIRVA